MDMFSHHAAANQGPDPVINLVEGGQKNIWGPLNQNAMLLNQSNSGNLEHVPRSSITFSNSNLHANTDAATTMTTAAGGGGMFGP